VKIWLSFGILGMTLGLLCACTISPAAVPSAAAPTQISRDASVPPRIFFVDADSGPTKGGPGGLGAPISIFGKGFGAARGTSKVMIGEAEAAKYLVWGSGNAHNKDLDLVVVQPGPIKTGGPIKIIVNGFPSNSDYSFTPQHGNIYYLSPSGSDSKSCSEAAPCATVANAVQIMKPGDIVLLRQGTYREGEIWIRSPQGGSADHPKAIKNYPGEEALMDNAARDFYIDADHITVSGLNFRNGKSLVITGWAGRDQRDNKLINNTFAGKISWAAIEITGHDHTLAGNVCDVSGSSVGTMGHCFYVTQGSNLKILYNFASGAPGYGLHIYDERRESKDFQRVIRDVLVEGNIFKGSRQRSGMVIAMTDAGSYGNHIENVTVRNNIFTMNNHAGLVVLGSSAGIAVYNNTFYQNGLLSLYVDSDPNINGVDIRNNLFFQSQNSNCSSECGNFREAHVQIGAKARNVTLAGNSYHPGKASVLGRMDSNPVTGDVLFVNESAQDFHIRQGSSVIARGSTISSVITDHDGRLRPQGKAYDIGAYEH
jgi:parallel beta-helix repeat protein